MLSPRNAAAQEEAKPVRHTVEHGGVKRTYHVYVPPEVAAAKDKPVPLVFALHEGDSRAERLMRYTRFNEAARKAGVVLVYPQGMGGWWNDGRSRVGTSTLVRDTDDVGFLVSLIDRIDKETHPIDRSRVFAAGLSNGGMMAYRLACEASEHFAGIAAVAANLPSRMEHRCRPERNVGVMIVHGTNDTIIPFRGGEFRQGLERLGKVLGTEETAAYFARRNGCALAPVSEPVENRGAEIDTETTRYDYPECVDSRVVLYVVERGGHTWPGATRALPERTYGKTSQEFDAAAAALDFFESLPVRE